MYNRILPINEVLPLLEAAEASQHVAIKNLEYSIQISTTIYTHFMQLFTTFPPSLFPFFSPRLSQDL